MRGVPNHLATKTDVNTCVNMALSGDLPKDEVVKKLNALSDDEKIWSFDSMVDSVYSPATDEKVIADIVDDVEVYNLFKFVDNPNSKLARIGMTKSEVQSLINKLQ